MICGNAFAFVSFFVLYFFRRSLEKEIDTIEDRGDISELDDIDGIIHHATKWKLASLFCPLDLLFH